VKRVLVSISLSVFILGCSLNSEFVKAVEGYANVVLPEYRTYIEKDTNLDDNTKRIRIQTADKFQELIDDAVLDVKGDK